MANRTDLGSMSEKGTNARWQEWNLAKAKGLLRGNENLKKKTEVLENQFTECTNNKYCNYKKETEVFFLEVKNWVNDIGFKRTSLVDDGLAKISSEELGSTIPWPVLAETTLKTSAEVNRCWRAR